MPVYRNLYAVEENLPHSDFKFKFTSPQKNTEKPTNNKKARVKTHSLSSFIQLFKVFLSHEIL